MSLTPRCQRCGSQGMCACQANFKTIHENKVQINPFSIEGQVSAQIESIKNRVLKLDKYQPTFEGLMSESEEYGEWIKLEDVLALFSEKK